ncbi:MAG: response regulator [Rhodospirillaceae bacterium]|nr:response regulator [Rhodospirillaceae bacterium]
MSLSQDIAAHLPLLRRYARALAGSQSGGDAYVRTTLESIIQSPDQFPRGIHPRVGLYRVFHTIWSGTHESPAGIAGAMGSRFRERLDALSLARRQALLLAVMEDFTHAEAGLILGRTTDDISTMVKEALYDLVAQVPVSVLIIEDEPVISMDLQNIVEEMGHHVCGTATTRREAVAAAQASKPGLVLADIQLADKSSGIDAVNEILTQITAPVIFITAYPERLLTGERPEPTFLVSKPFMTDTVKATIAQALLLAEDQKAPAQCKAVG